MAISTLDLRRVRPSVCPHCGRTDGWAQRHPWIETGLGILALAAMALLLVPLGILTWKACSNLLSESESHSILFHPLEDWSRYR
jgi:hypothetical protein